MNSKKQPILNRSAAPWGDVLYAVLLVRMLASPLPAQPIPAASNAAPTDPLAVLETHCVRCHGGEKTRGGLDLVTREALLRGGDSGPVVVPGQPDSSLLLQLLRHEKDPGMPHKEKKLPDTAIARIAEWVKIGVPYDRELDRKAGSGKAPAPFAITDDDRRHWAFQPVNRPPLPALRRSDLTVANPIDRFILARLEAAGLSLSPPATKAQLICRVTLDLIGLPPAPHEIDTFLNDSSPQAYERLIDRLLASPQYGERWGRHWLDLARFAETDGFEHDAVRPHSWRYRDYVIRAFNADKPYDRFVREQIAGDEFWPDDPAAITATGFNLLGPDMVDSSDQVQRRHNTLNDMTDTVALVFLGLTMGCARCHDHKFEPLSQHDYYRLQAFFTPARFNREQPISTPEEHAAFDEAMKKLVEHPTAQELAALEAPVRQELLREKIARLAPEAQAAHQTPPDQRTTEQANLALETADKVAISERDLAAAFSGEDKGRWKELLDKVKKLPKPAPLPKAMALARPHGPSAKTFVLHRGEYSQPGAEVAQGFPAVLSAGGWASRLAQTSARATSGRRTTGPSVHGNPPSNRVALAHWIASPDNPLTARVLVNRLWQHHFGRGLVATSSDFGSHGQKPTHPELLDWLAREFVARGWSLKQMHKLMLTSATYQQRSRLLEDPEPGKVAEPSRLCGPQRRDAAATLTVQGKGAIVDPDNRLFWRMNRLRLEGEVIRDSLLAISGQLNLRMGGPGVFPPIPKELFQGATGWTPSSQASDHSRRSIYIFVRRNLRFPFLEVFDAPDSNLSCPARERSVTAPQALALLNADEVATAAQRTAVRLQQEAGSAEAQIKLAYRLTLGRVPRDTELKLAREFLAESLLSEFCRALFNLNEFVYVE